MQVDDSEFDDVDSWNKEEDRIGDAGTTNNRTWTQLSAA